jgi:LPS export ABC transporter protein LptC
MIFEKEDEIRAIDLTVDFYGEDGQISSVLTSQEGTVHRRTNAMSVRGEVVVKAEDGRVLETETLHYDPQEKKIHTDDFVRLVDGRNVLTGYGLESDPDLQDGTFEIKRDVEATVLDVPEESAGH